MLKGKRVFITGSSRGIGRAIAQAFAKEGCRIALHYNVHKDLALETERGITKTPGAEAAVFQADLGDVVQIGKLCDAVKQRFGGVDILVNNAGIARDKTMLKLEPAAWQEVIDINLSSQYHLIRAFLPAMTESGWGRIINIASVVALAGAFGQTNYAAAKAGVLGLTKALAREVAGKGVTVNAVAPGYIDTDMTAAIPAEVKAKIIETIPLKRFGKPEEVAACCVFLASEAAAYVTGSTLNVNGGVYLQ
ncbi:MAG: 3-oxoacyl-[acyl-carrier-protein] reductase [Elusimicrobiota bacterium]